MLLLPASSVVLRMISDCSSQGYTGWYSVGQGVFNEKIYQQQVKGKVVAVISAFPWWSSAAPVEQYRQVMAKYNPGFNYESSPGSSTWATLQLFRTALSGVTAKTNVTAASVFTAYYALHNETLDGLLPQPLNFTRGKPAPQVQCFWVLKWQPSDSSPITLPPAGKSGNGATGDLASTCSSS